MTEIKVCGIKKEEDLLSLIDLNVTWAGFVFFKKSIRNVDYKKKELFNIAKNKIGIVSLFVNPENEFIDTIVHKVSPDLIQLHGSETPKRCFEIKKRFGIPVMKALQINGFHSLKQAYKYEDTVDKLLFDAKLTEEKLLLLDDNLSAVNKKLIKMESSAKKMSNEIAEIESKLDANTITKDEK